MAHAGRASSHKLDPGEPEERNIYDAMEAGKQVKKLPDDASATRSTR